MADISAKMVKELRDKTGAGMMDCKKALKETDGDLEKASEWLRQKGIASAEKKSGRVAAEGLVGQYIHIGGRVGVLVEVNCQTDFVARNEIFKELVHDVAMQIAANPNVEYVQTSDIPSDFTEREKNIEMGREDLASKPENIREKIVVGRIEKRLKELSLMDQPYIKDQSITVADLIKQRIAELGENIQVRRFVRFVLGEGIDKEEVDFAAEVAAQTQTKDEAPAKTPETPAPEAEAPAVEAPEAPAPEAEAPVVEAPEAPAPEAEAPAVEAPKTETSEPPAASKSEKPSKSSGFGDKPAASSKKGKGKKKKK